jgi:hypothetical protein
VTVKASDTTDHLKVADRDAEVPEMSAVKNLRAVCTLFTMGGITYIMQLRFKPDVETE